jgi:septum formation protein
MLKALSGKTHSVYTGVTILYATSGKISMDSIMSKADVTFGNITDDEINAYIATGEPMDKAGAYGIQGKGAVLVDSVSGDYYTIVGLPIAKVYQSLKANSFI